MLKRAGRALDGLNPKRAVVNIGATAQGIGAVYELAKRRGFTTTGIVSSLAKEQGVALSRCVDHVFYVKDAAWGGLVPDTTLLTPTSEAMVGVSHVLVAIGGGEVARDELLAARRMGKPVSFVPADMNHRLALDKAASKGLPAPTDFRGAAHAALLPKS
jgi:NADPH:quinone reductase-like Zn-dependent oxidoreductase